MAADARKSMEQLVGDLRQKTDHLRQGGGPQRLARQKEQGKLTARERIDALVDAGTFEELGLFAQHRQSHFGMAGREVARLGERVGALESGVRSQESGVRSQATDARPLTPEKVPAAGIDEETILVISAAVAAFLGKRPRIRQIHLVGSGAWAQTGRVTIQASHALSHKHG